MENPIWLTAIEDAISNFEKESEDNVQLCSTLREILEDEREDEETILMA